jgi:2-C-methyl-D-erythritol 4-phosphate cytidylyltransferase
MAAGAIVPAAGRGERLAAEQPKALVHVGGAPLLVHAARMLLSLTDLERVVIAAPADRIDEVRQLLPEVTVVCGGATRQDSVRLALDALPADVDIVLVHDAARALAPVSLADRVLAAVRGGCDAVVPGLPVTDTVKQVDADGHVLATVDRGTLRAVQTPQGFRRSVLEAVHRNPPDSDATDDAGLAEAAGIEVCVVAGEPEAFKVTTPFDLAIAEAVLRERLHRV